MCHWSGKNPRISSQLLNNGVSSLYMSTSITWTKPDSLTYYFVDIHPVGVCAQKGTHGYDDHPPPDLQGEGHCIHCLFLPCIVSRPPSFVTGQSGPHARNNQHRYRLYRCFWKVLKELGLWRNPQYLSRKCRVTHEDDPREIIPLCVVNVS